jgi:hypothetical protein
LANPLRGPLTDQADSIYWKYPLGALLCHAARSLQQLGIDIERAVLEGSGHLSTSKPWALYSCTSCTGLAPGHTHKKRESTLEAA